MTGPTDLARMVAWMLMLEDTHLARVWQARTRWQGLDPKAGRSRADAPVKA
jgi:hypothetical protein